MREQDLEHAADALVRWFQSQEIAPGDAIGVMIAVICGILRQSSQPAVGGALLADTIKEMLEDES